MSAYPPVVPSFTANTILVVNSDVPQSLTDAMTYCGLRGIPAANIRSFTFGTLEGIAQLSGLQDATQPGYTGGDNRLIQSTAPYNGVGSGASLLTVLDNEISNFGALCVLFSTYTPSRVVLFYLGAAAGDFALPAIAAAAPITLTWPELDPSGLPGVCPPTATTLAELQSHLIPTTWSTTTTIRPHGRIGCPDLTSASFAELPLASGATTVLSNAVANALTSESRNNVANPIHYSSVDNYTAGTANAYAQYIAAQGFPNAVDMGNQNALGGTLGSEFLLINPMSPRQNLWCALLMGGFNAGLYPFLWSGSGLPADVSSGALSTDYVDPSGQPVENAAATIVLSNGQIIRATFTSGSASATNFTSRTSSNVSAPFSLTANYGSYAYDLPAILAFQNNYSMQPGGFGGGWYSYSYNLGMNLLYNGASAAVMSVGEPYSSNIAYGSEIFHYLVNQRVPLCLANFYSGSWGHVSPSGQVGYAVIGSTVFGDPLYAPFKNTFPPAYGKGKGLIGGLKIGVS